MSLSGNLNEFSVLETLQVIALQQKTGTLRIRSGKIEYGLHFRDGKLVGCQPENSNEPDAFLDTLLGLGQVGRDEERRIRLLAAERGVDLWRQIVESVKLEEETLEETRGLVLQGVLDRVLLWNKGRFEFESSPVPPISGPPWNVETAMLESMRRLDEAADLKSGGFPLTAVPDLVPNPPSSSFESENPVPASLERALLSRIDGKRSIGALIENLHVAEYDVLTAIRDLRDQGVVRMEAKAGGASVAQILIEQPMRLRSPALAGFLILSCLGSLAVGAYAHRYTADTVLPTTNRSNELRDAVRNQTSILQGLEIFRQREGHYPSHLESLVDEGVWPEERADLLSGQTYELRTDETYVWNGVGSDDRIPWDAIVMSSATEAEAGKRASTSRP
ncbi:MAG: DUF4388 domain-containing protein [Candidatus Eisenbacteria bacterium]